MAPKSTLPSDPAAAAYATIRVTHHAQTQERATAFRRAGRPPSRPECIVIGHAWTEDAAREGGTICLVCHVVRLP